MEKIGETEKFFEFRLLFLKNGKPIELSFGTKGGVEYQFLEASFREIDRFMRSQGLQLLCVIPERRLVDKRVPVFITSDFSESTFFSIDGYLQGLGLESVKSNGKIRRVKNV